MKPLKIFKTSLFRGSLLILSANIVANFFNYLYHLVTGRLLATEQYGLLQSLLALIAFLGILAHLFSFSVINLVIKTNKNTICSVVKALEKQSLKFSFILWLVIIISFPLVKSFIHLDNFLLFFIFSLQAFFIFLPIIYQSVLRAKLKFFHFSLMGIMATFTKFIVAPGLILAGGKVSGAVGALIISDLTLILTGRYWINKFWFKNYKIKNVELKPTFWNFSVLSLITNLSLISLYSSDILLARHFLAPFSSGIYASVSVLGKIIFFGAAAVLIAIYPLLVKFSKNSKKFIKIFLAGFLLMVFITTAGIIIFKIFPKNIVFLLYGNKYEDAVSFLPAFSLFISLLAIFNLFIHLFLSLEKIIAGWLAGLAAFLQIIFIVFRHETIKVIIENSIASVTIALILSLFWIVKLLHEKR